MNCRNILLSTVLLIAACGGSGGDSTFPIQITGTWTGDLRQAGLVCVSEPAGDPSYINACTGCILSQVSFEISGGASAGKEVQAMRDNGCEMRGVRNRNQSLELFPLNNKCSKFLISTQLTFISNSLAEFVDAEATPDGPDADGNSQCSLDGYGELSKVL